MYKNRGEKQVKKKKAISIIMLVITIIVMTILATTVVITVTTKDMINDAQNVKGNEIQMAEKDALSAALSKWTIVETAGTKTFEEFMKEKFGEENVTTTSEDEVMVAMESGNKYNVNVDGTITSIKGIGINKSKSILELQENTTLTASLNEITGKIRWSNSDDSKVTISGTSGDSITLTAKAVGTTIITATCGNYKATCKVIVEEPIAIGSYVQYDIPYVDVFSNIEYTATTGWRYLGKDDAGNKLIISTGIPAILRYSYKVNIGNAKDGGANNWWATETEISQTTDTVYKTTKGYDYDTDGGAPNRYATYGLRYKFGRIPFTYQASGTNVSTENTGIFRKVGDTTSGTNVRLNFKANGVDVVDVHCLTLAELNRATNKASGTTRADTNLGAGFKNLTEQALGLFDMQKLDGYTQGYWYWLATPYSSYRHYVHLVNYSTNTVGNSGSDKMGIRPVVTLSSDVKLVDTNSDGVLEIKK